MYLKSGHLTPGLVRVDAVVEELVGEDHCGEERPPWAGQRGGSISSSWKQYGSPLHETTKRRDQEGESWTGVKVGWGGVERGRVRTWRYHLAARNVAQLDRLRRRISLTNVLRLTPPSSSEAEPSETSAMDEGEEGWEVVKGQMALSSSRVESETP